MSDLSVRSDSVDVEEIMRQIRTRIRDKRGVDYTEDEIRELANVKLEKFLDPGGVRSELLEQYRKGRDKESLGNYEFEDTTIYESGRPLLVWIRKILQPILKLFFNPNPLILAMHKQVKLNDTFLRSEALYYELIHNLVLETTRLGIEVKNLKMRVESMSSRLDFDERRARALEGVVQYRPGAVAPAPPPASGFATVATGANDADSAERRARRRRRRGRRRPDLRGGEAQSSGAETAEGADEPSGSEPADAPDAADRSSTGEPNES
jgi:hypothetical protein